MEFGLDNPEAAAHLKRQLETIAVIEDLATQVHCPPDAGSDLDVLVERIGTAPVHVGRGIQYYLQTSVDCLIHLRAVLTTDQNISTMVLQSLLRPVLMTSGRVVFILEPDDCDSQLERATMVLRQECDSYLRALKACSEFQHLHGLRPEPEIVADVESEVSTIRALAPRQSEGQVLDEMAERIAAAVAASSLYSDVASDVLRETVTHAWHTFSGGAHGYVWPDNAPGDFITTFGAVVPVTHWGMDLAVRRTRQ